MKIIHFEDPATQFVNDSIDQAIKDLPGEVITYTYDDLRSHRVWSCGEECVLFLEAGQTQSQHTNGWNLAKFKYWFPESKIVIWASDTQYYRVNNLGLQTRYPKSIDLVFELTPSCVDWWKFYDVPVATIPWTISTKLYKSLQTYRSCPVDKDNDFVFMANCEGEYRRNLITYLKDSGHSVITGGNHRRHEDYLDFARSYISIESSSHNRPELCLPGQRTLKGWRAAASIACSTLVLTDDDKDTAKLWPECLFGGYKYGEFDALVKVLKTVKRYPSVYKDHCEVQLQWLEKNLLDSLILEKLKEFNIL